MLAVICIDFGKTIEKSHLRNNLKRTVFFKRESVQQPILQAWDCTCGHPAVAESTVPFKGGQQLQ